MFFNPDGHEADDVFIETHLALHLGHGVMRGSDVHQRKVSLAVLADAVGQRLQAPVFGPADGTAIVAAARW
jgi:hypothetical protein